MNQKGFTPLLIILLFILVTLGGYLIYQNQFKATPAQPTPQPTADQVETANWKTYTNNELGFSIKYPVDAKFTQGGYYSVDGIFVPQPNAISLTTTVDKEETKTLGREGFQLTISVDGNKEDKTLSDLRGEINPDEDSPDLDWSGLKIKEAKVDGNPTIGGNTSGPYGSYTVITIYKGKIYKFVFEPTVSKTGEQILSSFKFTDLDTIQVIPINATQFRKSVVEADACNNPVGMVAYYDQDNGDSMKINSTKLTTTEPFKGSLKSILSYLDNTTAVTSNMDIGEWEFAFRDYCGGAQHFIFKEIKNVAYPNTDQAKAILVMGGQGGGLSISELRVYASTGDNVILLRRGLLDEPSYKGINNKCQSPEFRTHEQDLQCIQEAASAALTNLDQDAQAKLNILITQFAIRDR